MGTGNKYDNSVADALPRGEVVTCAFAVVDSVSGNIYRNSLFSAIPQTHGKNFDKHLKKRCAEILKITDDGNMTDSRVHIFREIVQDGTNFDVFYAALGILGADAGQIFCVPLPGFAELADNAETETEYPENAIEAYFLYAAAADSYEKRFDERIRNFIYRRLLEISEQAPRYYSGEPFSRMLYASNDTQVDICVILRSVDVTLDEVFRDTEFSLKLEQTEDIYAPVQHSKKAAAAIFCAVSLLLRVSEKKEVCMTVSRIKGKNAENAGAVCVKIECSGGAAAYCLLSYMHADLCFIRCCIENTGIAFVPSFKNGSTYIEFTLPPEDPEVSRKLPFFSSENEDEAPGDKVPGDKVPGDEVPGDEALCDEALCDEVPKDVASDEKDGTDENGEN